MLTDKALKAARPREKPYKLSDEKGLFLLVHPSGGRWWRLKYRFAGKEQLLSLGIYPDVALKRAREKREEARDLLDRGVNPSLHRKQERARKRESAANSFEAVAVEWIAKERPAWSEVHADRVARRLEVDVFPHLGTRPIADIEPQEVLHTIRKVVARGAIETAHRALSECSQVFRYAVSCAKAKSDPCRDLRNALPSVDSDNLAAITEPKAVGELLRAMRGYMGSPITAAALRLAPLVFVRPGELRHAEWAEFNYDKAEWRIPAEKMKGRQEHIVPLSAQALDVLKELQAFTGSGKYLFPSVRSEKRPMSENTVLGALRRLGYSGDQMTGHGFRAMARTLLAEKGWNTDAIERQLAHKPSGPLGTAYDRTQFLTERRRMMQDWADYLDRLAAETTNIVAGNFGKAA